MRCVDCGRGHNNVARRQRRPTTADDVGQRCMHCSAGATGGRGLASIANADAGGHVPLLAGVQRQLRRPLLGPLL